MSTRIYLTLAIALAVTSCNRKAEGQTVAIVNKQEITASELNAQLNNQTNAGNTKEARAAALQDLIDRKLLVQQAKSDGLDKSPEYLNQQQRMNDELLINMFVKRRANTEQLPTADEINKFEASHPQMFANREIWTLQQILYPLPKDQAVTAKLAASKSLDEVAQILTAGGVQFTRGTRKLDTAVFTAGMYKQVNGVPAGEPFIAPGPDKAVASVIAAREPAPLSGDQARQVAVAAIRREKVRDIVQDRLKSLRASAKIEYQSGYEPPKK
jgi:EpsD family peptidyl-prolyl cis-trans isomerase